MNENDVSHGLRAYLYDAVCSQIMDTLTGGAFLVAFALLLGASNTVVGLLAAISPLTQLVQLPAVYLVDRMPSRKTLVVLSSFLSRVFWFVVPLIPWFASPEQSIPVLLACLFLYFGLGSVSACGFNPWVRDFVPEEIMGRYFGKCLAAATAAGVVLAVLAGMGIEIGKSYTVDPFVPYGVLFFLGGMFGLSGVYFLTRIPEPRVTIRKSRGVFETLAPPIRDLNFRRLLIFLGVWFFAINLAGPFYAVYMIKQLELSMAFVMCLSAVSQVMSVISFRIWGRVADKFSNKSVLFLAGYLYICGVLLWPFLVLAPNFGVMIPLLIIVHTVTGISAAGVNLCTANIVLKTAPFGKSTPFLALNTLMHGVAGATAPILGGIIADWLTGQEQLLWQSTHAALAPESGFRGICSIFFITAILGLFALRRLAAVREEGEVAEQVVFSYLVNEVRSAVRAFSNFIGLLHLRILPFRYYRKNRSRPLEGHENRRPVDQTRVGNEQWAEAVVPARKDEWLSRE